jgi:glyoxylase-like metal-dependent hydrolase (beta-lactamase superfamily II)
LRVKIKKLGTQNFLEPIQKAKGGKMQKPDIKSFFDPATATWTYVVWSEESKNKNCAIIDSVLDYDVYSGRSSTNSADQIINFIKEKNLTVEWILETHVHADHLTASKYLKEKLGGKIAISNHITTILKTWQEIFHNEIDTPLSGEQFDHLFADDEVFKIGDLEAKILYTPGHTPADTSYVIGDSIFVGDAIFLPDVGSGRCDFPGGSAEDSFDSSRKILSFPNSYKIYVGHDYPEEKSREAQSFATVEEQKAKNIRFRDGISKNEFVEKRKKDDIGKSVPKLLLPSIQVNLRAGSFGKKIQGEQYIKLPLNKI